MDTKTTYFYDIKVTPKCNFHNRELQDIGSGITWDEDGISDLSEFTCPGLDSTSTDEEFEICGAAWYLMVVGHELGGFHSALLDKEAQKVQSNIPPDHAFEGIFEGAMFCTVCGRDELFHHH